MAGPNRPSSAPNPANFGEYLTESAARDPVGRLVIEVYRLGSQARMAAVAESLRLSDDEFGSIYAEAEWGGLVKREERDDGIFLILTPQGNARAEALTRLTSHSQARAM
jgi:hypothetical protein